VSAIRDIRPRKLRSLPDYVYASMDYLLVPCEVTRGRRERTITISLGTTLAARAGSPKAMLTFSILLAVCLGVLLRAPQAALAGPPDASSISAGDAHACAIEGDRAYCWGNGGALGDNSFGSSRVPVAVNTGGALAGKTLTQISVGGNQTCALDSIGEACCWG
jgi:hypothetical protein